MNGIEFKNINELSEDFVMDSLQLCKTINRYRQEEGKEKILQHCDLMKSIRKELEALEKAGIGGEGNFSLTSYTDIQNKKQPCFALTKFGAMQILNKESAYVRYRTQEYVEELEYRNSVLQTPYEEMAEDRIANGYNLKEILNYIDSADIDELDDIKQLMPLLKQLGYYPYAAYVKTYFDTIDPKHLEKLTTLKDIKENGIITLSSKEFIDLLESNKITYTSKGNKLYIGDLAISKNKIKVISEKALIHLALTVKGSEIAKQYRKYLIDNQLIELHQISDVINEKDIKEIYQLQQQTIEIINRLNDREDRLNEKEDRLNEKENRLNEKEDRLNNFIIEDKGKLKLRDRIKKAFKIIFGGDNDYHTHEIVINEYKVENNIESTIDKNDTVKDVVEAEIIQEFEESVINEYHSPSETRGPICDEPIGKMVVTAKKIKINPQGKNAVELRRELHNTIKRIEKKYNIEGKIVRRQAYDELQRRFNKPYKKRNKDDSIVERLTIKELKVAIEYLDNKYPWKKATTEAN